MSATQVRVRKGHVLLTLAVMAGLTVLVLATPRQDTGGRLDPGSYGPSGSHALASVLRAQGVDVVETRTLAEAVQALATEPSRTTLAVGAVTTLGVDYGSRVLDAAAGVRRVVLLDGSPEAMDAFDLPMTSQPTEVFSRRPADCATAQTKPFIRDGESIIHSTYALFPDHENPAARWAGTGPLFCYPLTTGGSALAELPGTTGRPEVVVLGSAAAATNERVADADHAALLLRLLGGSDRLVWYSPSPFDIDATVDAGRGIPPWLGPLQYLLALAVLVLAVAQGRRLGRPVVEPLPVAIRASETTRSRAELYRLAQDRERAAGVLREATVRRLRSRLAAGRGASVASVVELTAARTGMPSTEVAGLLTGPTPPTDSDLRDLGQHLAALEERVRHP